MLLLLALLSSTASFSQILGYGPKGGVPFPVDNGKVVYTDNQCRLWLAYPGLPGTNPIPTGPTTAKVIYAGGVGIPKVKDKVMIYAWDPEKPDCGRFAGGDVLSVDQATKSIEIDFRSVSLMNEAVALLFQQRCFLVSVLYENKIILGENGVITCHPWDYYGGGICAIVTNTLEINGGSIDASGKGYVYRCGPMNSQYKGIGGAADPSYSGGGSSGEKQNNDTLCMLPNWTGCRGSDGTDGDDPGSLGTAGSTLSSFTVSNCRSSFSRFPANSNYNNGSQSVILMGEGTISGSVAASGGGQGGGYGGNGGNACNNINSGNTGNPGEKGEDGKEFLGWARGGGIIIIKAEKIIFSTAFTKNPKPVCIARGEDGFDGPTGGNGGQGGTGGTGGQGACIAGQINHSGGNGGHGAPGIGGDGGDGSEGGKPGTIWILTQSPTEDTLGNPWWSNDVIDINGGLPGGGGPGGFSLYRLTEKPSTFDLAGCSPYSWCPINAGSIDEVCDCEYVMCLLSKMDASSVNNTSGDVAFSGSGTSMTMNYEALNNRLITSVDMASNTQYYCPFYQQQVCNAIFKKIGQEADPQNGIKVDLKNTDKSTCPTNIFWKSNHTDKPTLLEYNKSNSYIKDITSAGQPKCYLGNCPPGGGGYAYKINRTGSSGRNWPYSQQITTFNPSSQTSRFYMMSPAPAVAPLDTTQLQAKQISSLFIGPNPTDGVLNIYNSGEPSEITFTLYDLVGRTIYRRFIPKNQTDLKITIDISNVNAGLYIATVKNGEQISTVQIIKR